MYPINEIGMNTNQTYITEKYTVPTISTFYQITKLDTNFHHICITCRFLLVTEVHVVDRL